MLKQTGALLAAMLVIFSGCGEGQGRAKKAGRAVGKTVTDFAAGVGSGIDKGLEVEVELSQPVSELGLHKTVSKNVGIDGGEKGLAVYFISERPAAVRLVAKALNEAGQEIGRSAVDVEFAADDAKYVTFRFDPEMDRQMVRKYVIDAKAATPADLSPDATGETESSQ